MHLGRFPAYVLAGTGAAGVVAAWTATTCWFFEEDWVDLPFFRSHRFLLLSDDMVGVVATVVVVDGVEGVS